MKTADSHPIQRKYEWLCDISMCDHRILCVCYWLD